MCDDVLAGTQEAHARDDRVRSAGELAQHPLGVLAPLGLPVHAVVEDHSRVDPERKLAFCMDRARLPLGVQTHELGGREPRHLVLDVLRRLGLERDPELLEDRAPLRRRGSEDQPRLRATHISSEGHCRAQSAVTYE